MLDRETKDTDAGIEILDDRKKQSKIVWIILFIIGWCAIGVSAAVVPYKYDEIGFGFGIAFLIFATWFFINVCYYNTLIVMRKLDKSEK